MCHFLRRCFFLIFPNFDRSSWRNIESVQDWGIDNAFLGLSLTYNRNQFNIGYSLSKR